MPQSCKEEAAFFARIANPRLLGTIVIFPSTAFVW